MLPEGAQSAANNDKMQAGHSSSREPAPLFNDAQDAGEGVGLKSISTVAICEELRCRRPGLLIVDQHELQEKIIDLTRKTAQDATAALEET